MMVIDAVLLLCALANERTTQTWVPSLVFIDPVKALQVIRVAQGLAKDGDAPPIVGQAIAVLEHWHNQIVAPLAPQVETADADVGLVE